MADEKKKKLSRRTNDFLQRMMLLPEPNEEAFLDEFAEVARDFCKKKYSAEEAVAVLTKAAPPALVDSMLERVKDIYEECADAPEERRRNRPDSEAWVREWLRVHKVTMEYSSELFRMNGEETTIEFLKHKLKSESEKAKYFYVPHQIDSALYLWKQDYRKQRLEHFREFFTHDPKLGISEVEKFVEIFTDKQDPYDVQAVYKFAHQVGRSVLGLGSVNEILLGLYSLKGGVGKSYLVQRLLKPLWELVSPDLELSVLTDSREAPLMMNSFVGVLEELAPGNSKTDMAAIKAKLTAKGVNTRQLGGHGRLVGERKMNFISTANQHLSVVFRDYDQARRFWELERPQYTDAEGNVLPQTYIDHKKVADFDPVKFWKSINYLGETEFDKRILEFRTVQNSRFRAKDTVEMFVESRCAKGSLDEKKTTTVKELYEHYKTWMNWQELKGKYTYNNFGDRLDALGYRRAHTRVGNVVNLVVKTDEENAA